MKKKEIWLKASSDISDSLPKTWECDKEFVTGEDERKSIKKLVVSQNNQINKDQDQLQAGFKTKARIGTNKQKFTKKMKKVKIQVFKKKEKKAALIILGLGICIFDYLWSRKKGKSANGEGKNTVLA